VRNAWIDLKQAASQPPLHSREFCSWSSGIADAPSVGGALALKAYRPDLAATIKPFLDKTSNLSLIALMTLQTLLNVRSVMAVVGTGGILAGVLFLAVGFVVGWALGGPAIETRSVLGFATAQRNIAAALVVANQSFDDPNVVVMVIVIAIVGLLTLMPLSRVLGRRVAAAPVAAVS